MSYYVVVGGGISEVYTVVHRKSPGAAINAWFNNLPRRPLDVWLDADSDSILEPDYDAYRSFWEWVLANPDKVEAAESKAYNKKGYPYVYGYVSREAAEKAAKLAGASNEELEKEFNWSGWGPFTGG